MIAPLDWGLGHATRCIPLINELVRCNCDVFIAARGAIYSLLKQEFPGLCFFPLTGYSIKYSKKKYFLPAKIIGQLPKIMLALFEEHHWLKRIVKEYKFDAVISDNRFGMYHPTITSIYITHQLSIRTGNTFTGNVASWIHHFFIKKYKQCWVPDFEHNGLAGILSHPNKLPGNIKYLGALSRFEPNATEIKYDLLVSISGPEPQRTIFEEQILDQLVSYDGKVLFIRGLPDNNEELNCKNPRIQIKNHLPAKQLNDAILQSEIFLGRCGYTTIMDLVKLQKKAILIPTPGQSEQEYLAEYLIEKKIFFTISQKDFILQEVLHQITTFPFAIPNYNMQQYKDIIHQFVRSL